MRPSMRRVVAAAAGGWGSRARGVLAAASPRTDPRSRSFCAPPPGALQEVPPGGNFLEFTSRVGTARMITSRGGSRGEADRDHAYLDVNVGGGGGGEGDGSRQGAGGEDQAPITSPLLMAVGWPPARRRGARRPAHPSDRPSVHLAVGTVGAANVQRIDVDQRPPGGFSTAQLASTCCLGTWILFSTCTWSCGFSGKSAV